MMERLRHGVDAVCAPEKIVRSGKNAENARDMYAVFSREAMDVIDSAGRTVMAACSEGDTLRTNLAVLLVDQVRACECDCPAPPDRRPVDRGRALRRLGVCRAPN